MAVIKLGGGVTDIRGSIGGTVFSRGPAGAYARQRVKAVNPATSRQLDRRRFVSALSFRWSYGLDTQERADWVAWAAATSFLNKVGDSIHISGLAAFLRLNALRMLIGEEIEDAAPEEAGMADQTIYVPTANKTTLQIQIAEPTSGWDGSNTGQFLIVFAGLPMAPGRTASPRGYRYIGMVQGAAEPPSFPQSFTWPYTAEVGQNYPVRVTHLDAAGRVSTPSDVLVAVTAP
jgi:hypothetical protein